MHNVLHARGCKQANRHTEWQRNRADRIFCESLLNAFTAFWICVRLVYRRMTLFTFYCSVIKSVLEYACPVWHPGLTSKLSKDIKRVQKRCLRIIFPQLSDSEALDKSGLNRLDTRREEFTKQIFRQIKSPTHQLHYLIPPPKVSSSQMILRPTYPFKSPRARKLDMVKISFCTALQGNNRPNMCFVLLM